MRMIVLLVGLITSIGHTASMQWPEGQYDPSVPSPRDVLGYELGEHVTPPAEIVRYILALNKAAPQRTRLVEYAKSWQGRPLHYLVIGSADQIERLDAIKAETARLADPRTFSKQDLDTLVESHPTNVWLAYGVHGNEISSPDAALATAYYLLAHPNARRLFDDVLVVIDPLQNPDGRNRFVQHYLSQAGLVPNGSSIAAERREPWPSGRFNNYLFDLNRDWFAITQPETLGRVAAFREFLPQVYVDLHEMGHNSTYYFPPAAVPFNPVLPEDQLKGQNLLGQSIASAFDAQGFRYYNREHYDLYYPGYGDSWPALNGSIGMTFEMAGARGLIANRHDGTQLAYADGVQRHFTAGIATIAGSAANREHLLRGFFKARQGITTDFIISREGDVGAVDSLVDRLISQGIEVRRISSSARICGSSRAAGSYVVTGNQPAGRLAQTLLASDTPLSEAFWREQERLASKRLPLQVYDTIAWSLQHMSNVEVDNCNIAASMGELIDKAPPVTNTFTMAKVAYIVPWGSRSASKFLSSALRTGVVVEAGDKAFIIDDREYPAGTLIIRTGENGEDLYAQMLELAASTGAEVVGLNSSWVDEGLRFGSNEVKRFHAPNIAIAWGRPISPSSAGAVRYVLEQKLGYPTAPVWVSDLGSPYLDEFDVLILPDSRGYGEAIGNNSKANIDRWVRQGGALVAIGRGIEVINKAPLDLLATQVERLAGTSGKPKDESSKGGSNKEKQSPLADGVVLEEGESLDKALAPHEQKPPAVLGAILNANVDFDHWLANGLRDRLRFLVTGDNVYTPLRRDKGVNVVSYAGTGEIRAAGYLWDASRDQLAHKPVVMASNAGRGVVVGFAADPTFRGYMDGLDVLFANAVFTAAARSSPVRRPASY